MNATDSAISLEGVSKSFGTFPAVREANFPIGDGEFFTMLGPSGCGKTTTLRMIAGFEQPTTGRILLRGDDVTTSPPNRRNVNMVFQHYALFPHMTVYDNVAFGLKLKKVGEGRGAHRVGEILEIVALTGMEKRKPQQLSGGQQQRVALARALVNRPAALLLDEPLGALDVKLRRALQLELKRIQHETGTTFVYVTHDQEEALAMSDQIAVMNDGVVDQIGSPREIYETPATPFVADFVGSLNALDVEVAEVVGDHCVAASTRAAGSWPGGTGRPVGARIRVAVRPERVRRRRARRPRPRPTVARWLAGTVAEVVYLGMLTQYHVETAAGRVVSHRMNDDAAPDVEVGSLVTVEWAAEDTRVLGAPRRRGRPYSAMVVGCRRQIDLEPALEDATPDLRRQHDHHRHREHDHRHGDHLRQQAREAQLREQVERERRRVACDERRQDDLVEREDERDEERRTAAPARSAAT